MTPGRCFFVKALLYFPDDESFMKQYQKLNFVNPIKFSVKLPDDKIEFEFCQSWFFIDFGKSIFDVYLLEALRQNDFIAFCVSSEVLLCKVCKEGF